MKTKFNAYETTLYEFIDKVYVVCPQCENQAIVCSGDLSENSKDKEMKLVCPKCGMNKYFLETPMCKWVSNGVEYKSRGISIGANVDPYFRLSLWLQKELPDGLLWAYNYEHLSFIENHVSAELRNRENSPMRNKSLGSRLPKWMTSKKNRAEILNGIEKLKRK